MTNAMSAPVVLCLGEAVIDRLRPIKLDKSFRKGYQDCFGGAPANVACALAKLGTDVGFIGSIGNDLSGRSFKELMLKQGVNIQGLQLDETRPTRIVSVRLDEDGDRTFGGFEGDKGMGFADQAILESHLQKQWMNISANSKWLLVGTIPLASDISSKACLWSVRNALNNNIRIALDINWRPTFWAKEYSDVAAPSKLAIKQIQPLIESASLLKVAKEEAIWFFNTDNPKYISEALPQSPDVVVTDGANPVKWILNNQYGELPTIKTSFVVDTTGAGDAFTAGLLFKLLTINSHEIDSLKSEEIIRFAMACGACVCAGFGAIDAQPNLQDVSLLLAS